MDRTNKPCVGLASSTAYASKLNLDIFVSLFGAGKNQKNESCLAVFLEKAKTKKRTREVLVDFAIVLSNLHHPPDSTQLLLRHVRILVQAWQPPSLPIAPQRKPKHLLHRRVLPDAQLHRLPRLLAREREEDGDGHRRRRRDAPAGDGRVQVRERVRRVRRRHHPAQRRLGRRPHGRHLLPREEIFLRGGIVSGGRTGTATTTTTITVACARPVRRAPVFVQFQRRDGGSGSGSGIGGMRMLGRSCMERSDHFEAWLARSRIGVRRT